MVWARDYEAFRRRLIAARKRSRLTQQQVADRLRRPQSFVAKAESGERRVDIVELAQFARVYRRSLAYFAPFI